MQLRSSLVPNAYVITLLLTTALTAPVHAQRRALNGTPKLTFTPLGTLPTGSPDVYSESFALGVSGDGKVIVGQDYIIETSVVRAFRWENGQMTALPSRAYATSNSASGDGKVVAGNTDFFDADGIDAPTQAFRWDNGQTTGLGFLPGYEDSFTSGISADGKVIAGSSSSAETTQAFRWEAGKMVGLGFLPGGTVSDAYSLSANGKVVVGLGNFVAGETRGTQAFRWENGVMSGLGFLPLHDYSTAVGASDSGKIVVGSSQSTDSSSEEEELAPRAFRWENGQMVSLGTQPGGTFSYSYDVSGDGAVVVGMGDSSTAYGPFLWRSDLGMVSLEEFAQTHDVEGMDGWQISSVNKISADGSTVVGQAYNTTTGAYMAYALRATVPGGFRTLGYTEPAVLGRSLLQGLAPTAAPRPVTFELRPAGGGQPTTLTQEIGTAREGQNFTLAVPAGSYTLAIQGAGYLRTTVPVEVTETGGVAIPDVTLLVGDINNDNKINLTDLVLLRANYGKQGVDLAGDLNGDGRVNLTDLVLLRANYGLQGAP